MDANYPCVTRQDILNFPFPYKLWLVVNLDYCDFLRWNRDGTVVLLDLVTLEDYLNSTRSIFKIKNSSSFLQHLDDFKFKRINSTPEADEDILLQYQNENFQRYRLDLLGKIRRYTYQLIGQQNLENTNKKSDNVDFHYTCITKYVSKRMMGDLCFMFHGGLSKIKKSRLRFQTILHFNNEQRILKDKLQTSESTSEEDQVIELPVELFENPHDSVLNLSEDILPEYAGYYGNCSKDQILQFFGEYLPMYEDGSMEVKKIVAENTTANNPATINAEPNVMQYYSPGVTENPNVFISTPIAPNSMANLNFSSNLEPIFLNSENSENINLNNATNDYTVTYLNLNTINSENDIAMEEFLKFKDPPVNCQQNTTTENFACGDYNSYSQQQIHTKTFPQMPTSFQMEINEDVKENEENFRNFFSQYKASLNLLYERQ